MSAIAAVVTRDGPDISASEIEPIVQGLAYRGAGTPHVWHSGRVALIEATNMVRATDERQGPDGSGDEVRIVVDAHLACRRDLIDALKRRDRPVDQAASDRELIRHAYLTWGLDCVDHLFGEWAFIAWDPREQKLIAVHDQLGARELAFTKGLDTLVVSNELMAVVQHPSVKGEIYEGAIAQYLLFGTPRRPGDSATTFQDVHRLLPAHRLVAGRDGVRTERYWDFPLDEPMLRYQDPRDYVAHFRSLLADAVADRLDQVPRAVAHLSGGLDSTAVTTIAAELVAAGRISTELSAISVVYDRIAPDTEAYYSNLVAERLALPTQFVVADQFTLQRPVTIRAEPLQDFASGMSRNTEAVTAATAPLVLSGKGADELLAPTPLHEVLLLQSPVEAVRLYRWLWQLQGRRPALGGYKQFVSKLVRGKRVPSEQVPYMYPRWLNPDFTRRVDLEERWRETWTRVPPKLHKTQPDVARWLGESRWNIRDEFVPASTVTPSDATFTFGDLRLIRFVMSLPPSPWNTRKRLLREAMADALPRDVLERPKTPPPFLQLRLVNRAEASWIDDWEPTSALRRYVDPDQIPPIFQTDSLESAAIDSKPLFLNEWFLAHGIA